MNRNELENEEEKIMFFKKKEKNLLAPVSGKTIEIEKVNDPVFAQKMMGDGFAIEPSDDTFYALCNGKLTALFPSNHAYGITTEDGLEILVHIGLDTINENGQGFTCNFQLNDTVKAGDAIIHMDSNYLKEKGYDLTTMVIFTNPKSYEKFQCTYGKEVKGGNDIVATYK